MQGRGAAAEADGGAGVAAAGPSAGAEQEAIPGGGGAARADGAGDSDASPDGGAEVRGQTCGCKGMAWADGAGDGGTRPSGVSKNVWLCCMCVNGGIPVYVGGYKRAGACGSCARRTPYACLHCRLASAARSAICLPSLQAGIRCAHNNMPACAAGWHLLRAAVLNLTLNSFTASQPAGAQLAKRQHHQASSAACGAHICTRASTLLPPAAQSRLAHHPKSK